VYVQNNHSHSSALQGNNHIRNWAAYDHALVQRGSLTVWISEEALAAWAYQ